MPLKDRVTDAAYAGGWAAVRWMPEGAARWTFQVIADRATTRGGGSVQQLRRNLARVAPDSSDAELDALVQEGMRRYLRYWREAFRLPTLTPAEISASVDVEGYEQMSALVASDRGVVIACPHMGNYDLVGAWFTLEFGQFTTVAERLKPESLFERFLEYRQSLGMEVLPLTGGPRVLPMLTSRLREGGVVALVGDRDLTAHGIPVDFFGERASMPSGPAAMALATGAALVPATLWYDGDRSHVRFYPEVDVPEGGSRRERIGATVQRVADVFAEGIAAHPVDWHMLQALWSADLDPARRSVTGEEATR